MRLRSITQKGMRLQEVERGPVRATKEKDNLHSSDFLPFGT